MGRWWSLLAVLAACMVSCGPAAGIPSRPAELGAYPVTFVDRFGTTVLTKVPQRIAVLGMVEQDAFLALGVVPIATREWFGHAPGAIFPWAQAKLGGQALPEVISDPLDFGKIAALHPDVIVALYASLTADQYHALSAIAPTIGPPPQYVDWGVPWQEITLEAGRIVGRPAEAQALVTSVEEAFAAARASHPEFRRRSAFIVSGWGWPESAYVYSSEDARGRFLQNLGFAPSVAIDRQAGKQFGATLPRANLATVDGDLVVWLPVAPEQESQIRGDPMWKTTRAALAGRTVFLPPGNAYYAALNFASVLSLPYAIAGLVPAFQGALRGESAR